MSIFTWVTLFYCFLESKPDVYWYIFYWNVLKSVNLSYQYENKWESMQNYFERYNVGWVDAVMIYRKFQDYEMRKEFCGWLSKLLTWKCKGETKYRSWISSNWKTLDQQREQLTEVTRKPTKWWEHYMLCIRQGFDARNIRENKKKILISNGLLGNPMKMYYRPK